MGVVGGVGSTSVGEFERSTVQSLRMKVAAEECSTSRRRPMGDRSTRHQAESLAVLW